MSTELQGIGELGATHPSCSRDITSARRHAVAAGAGAVVEEERQSARSRATMAQPAMYDVVTRSILGWLAANTYIVVFVGTLIDASGVPFPGRLLLVAAGALAGPGRRSLVAIIALAAAAAVLMDHAWYLAGRWGGERLLRLGRRVTGRAVADSEGARRYFARYGAATIVLGRFFTSVRVIAWPVAAAHGVGYPTFLALDLGAAGLWASLWVVLGWMAGERWESAATTAGPWLTLFGVVFVVAMVLPVAVRLHRRRRGRRGRSPLRRA
jgi:membrane protein DedA with SNARE-associated domain